MTPREFLRRLACGTNVPREAILACTLADFGTIQEDGFTWLRSFIPASRSGGYGVRLNDEAATRRYLDAWATAAAQLPVVAACHDVCELAEAADPALEQHVRMVARLVAEHPGLTPARFALAALNEAAGDQETPAEWHPHLKRLTDALRAALPNHVLAIGGHKWSNLDDVADAPPPADEGTIIDVHVYWPPWGQTWADRRDKLLRLGRGVIVGEVGPGAEGERDWWPEGPFVNIHLNPAAWPARWAEQRPLLTALPCALWAHEAPGKQAYRLNIPDGFALRPELAGPLRALALAAAEANPWICGHLEGRLDGLREGIEKGQRVGETLGRAVGRRLGWDAAVAAVQADVGSRYAYREAGADG